MTKNRGNVILNASTSRRSASDREQQKYISLPYEKAMYKSLREVAKRTEITLAPKRSRTLFSALRNDEKPYPKQQLSGVHTIPMYNKTIGQHEEYTGVMMRNLPQRISEHQQDIMNAHLSTSLAKRFYEYKLNINWKPARIVRTGFEHKHAYLQESLVIAERGMHENVINEQPSTSFSSAWSYEIIHKL